MDPTLYGTNSSSIPTRAVNDNDFENRLYFTLLNKNIKKCNTLNSTNMSNCNTFYNNAPANISNRINSEYTNASSYVYSNPVDAPFQDFPALDDTKCTPTYAKNRTQAVLASYTFPIINIHNTFITTNFTTANIQFIKNLKINENTTITNISNTYSIKFTRINDSYPEQYTLAKILNCNSKAYRTQQTINDLWTQTTGCSNTLNTSMLTSLGTSYDTLQYNTQNETDVTSYFNQYTKINLYKSIQESDYIYDKIIKCNSNTNYIVITRNDLMNTDSSYKTNISIPYRLNKGISFSTTNGDIPVLKRGDWELWFLTNGNLYILYTPKNEWNRVSTNITETNSNNNNFTFLHDGNVVIYQNTVNVWNSGASWSTAKFLELSNIGNLKIKDTNSSTLYDGLYKNAKFYIQTKFYYNCPNAMFSDKYGRVFKFTWADYESGRLINNVPSNGGGDKDRFRGFQRADADNEWKVTERNLVHINGYDTQLNGNQPVVGDDNTYNYNNDTDRDNFYTDCCKPSTKNIRKPRQFSIGGTDKTNYIPGYIRISYVDGTGGPGYSYQFLVLVRSGWNQSFVLFQKYHSNITFANDVYDNHPDLVTLLNND